MVRIVLITFMLFIVHHAAPAWVAQVAHEDPKAWAERNLTNKNQREWRFKKFVYTREPKPRCVRGETWTFQQDGRVVIQKCRQGTTLVETKNWTVRLKGSRAVLKNDEYEYILKIDEREYILLFPKKSEKCPGEEMRLRIDSGRREDITTDLVFCSEKS